MNYYYSQKFSGYKNYGIGTPTMGEAGCLITCLAMILSYFNDRPFYPNQMLSWGRENGMLDSQGRTRFDVFSKAAGGKLRLSGDPNETKPDERIFGLREVRLPSRMRHWIIDHPNIPDKIIDSYDGRVKDYDYFRGRGHGEYTGRVYYYIGKQ